MFDQLFIIINIIIIIGCKNMILTLAYKSHWYINLKYFLRKKIS